MEPAHSRSRQNPMCRHTASMARTDVKDGPSEARRERVGAAGGRSRRGLTLANERVLFCIYAIPPCCIGEWASGCRTLQGRLGD